MSLKILNVFSLTEQYLFLIVKQTKNILKIYDKDKLSVFELYE